VVGAVLNQAQTHRARSSTRWHLAFGAMLS